jgi:hypothetical protein
LDLDSTQLVPENQAFPRHFGRLGKSHEIKNRWRNIGGAPANSQLYTFVANQEHGDGIDRVLGMRLTGHWVHHFIAIAVISREDDFETVLKGYLGNPMKLEIKRFYRTKNGRDFGGMTDHVTIGKIDNNKVILVAFQCCNDTICDFGRTHFGLEIIGGYLWRWNDLAILSRKGFFAATVKKIGDMRIFFRFCAVELLQAGVTDDFAKTFVGISGGNRTGKG